jgi:ribosomal-protein-alanine N-acetyltransferase
VNQKEDWQARVTISPATWRDWRSTIAFEKLCFGKEAWAALDIAAALTLPNIVRYKAEFDNQMIGLVVGNLRPSQRMAWIATIGVHPDYRRRGLGQRLLRTCEKAMGMPRIKLTLRVSNLAALSLYRQEGYHQIDTWRNYYTNGEDALVMEKWMP